MNFARTRFKAMGSPCELHLYGESRAGVERVGEAARAEVMRLERKYSRYREDSLGSAINRSAGDPDGVEVDEETAGLLDYAACAWHHSGGLFDITSGVLRRAWDFKSGRLPTQEEIEPMLARVGWQHVRWQRPRLVLPVIGMQLDFGGYVKEYAADCVADRCRALGLRHGLVDLGGDLAVIGPHPDGSAWRVGIRDPSQPERALGALPLRYGGIASSGDYERCMVVDGKRYGHILSPMTGWPVEGLLSVSVVAPRCLIAGSAATIGMLQSERAGAAWLDELGLPNLRVAHGGRVSGSLVPDPADGVSVAWSGRSGSDVPRDPPEKTRASPRACPRAAR